MTYSDCTHKIKYRVLVKSMQTKQKTKIINNPARLRIIIFLLKITDFSYHMFNFVKKRRGCLEDTVKGGKTQRQCKKKDANHRKFIHILFHVVKTSISALLSNYNDVCLSDVDIDTENQKKNGNDISFQQAFQNQK